MKRFLILNLISPMLRIYGEVKKSNNVSIEDFPHTAFLKINSAHCVYDCEEGSVMSAYVGDTNINKGTEIPVVKVLVHEYFDPETFIGDIAMLKLKTSVTFGTNVKKVLISRDPPYYEQAQVSGWGVSKVPLPCTFDDSEDLRAVTQNIWINRKCMKTMPNLPQGCRCSNIFDGVSGSPLVVRGYIQLGILSLQARTPTGNVTVYTDVGYYFSWIESNIPTAHCSDEIPYTDFVL